MEMDQLYTELILEHIRINVISACWIRLPYLSMVIIQAAAMI